MATNNNKNNSSINIFIKEGKNLAAKDAGNTSDPYCKVNDSTVIRSSFWIPIRSFAII